MNTKVFELRDRATFIPIMVVRWRASHPDEEYLFMRSGWPSDAEDLTIFRLEEDFKPAHRSGRTMEAAYAYIHEHFDDLKPGQVIDVEFILGETAAPKVSERLG